MSPESNVLSRRQVLAGAAAAGALSLMPKLESSPRKRALRIAHLTDIHVQPERKADQGMGECLKIVNELSDKPDVIFTGGDLIMDSFNADPDRTKVQWDLFTKGFRENNRLPVEHCIGNHDLWMGKGKTEDNDRRLGKQWACDILELEKPYRSFDRAGWHFIFLDSTFPEGSGYKGRLDDAQFEWLAGDLAGTPKTTPVMVISHIPILSASAYFDGDNEKTGNWVVPGAWMHLDARKIKDLFAKHPNVKLCISGHIHLVDRVDYNGVTYFCNGAVCGGWWNGNYHECAPGYALVDLYDDGTFENRYVEWGWQPKP